MTRIKIGGIIQSNQLAQVGVVSAPNRPNFPGILFESLGAEGINIQFIAESIDRRGQEMIVFCIDQKDLAMTLEALARGPDSVSGEKIVTHCPVGIVSVFGPHFREKPTIAGTMFSALGKAGIKILAISTSISTLSCVVDEAFLPKAVQVISDAFELP